MYHMIMVLFKKSRLLRRFFSRGYAKHRNGYLLGDRLCKCVTHSDANFWPRTCRVWVRVSCRPQSGHFGYWGLLLWKYLKLCEVWILLLWWCIGHNSAAGEVKELNCSSQSQEVASCLLRFISGIVFTQVHFADLQSMDYPIWNTNGLPYRTLKWTT